MKRSRLEEMELIAERNEILRQMDVDRMKAFLVKVYGPNCQMPSSDEVMTVAMHKLRFNLSYFNYVEKVTSELWLKSNGYATRFI